MSHSAQNMLQIFSVPLNLSLVIFKDKLPYILPEKKRKWCRNCLNSVLSHTVYIYPRSFLSPIFPSQWKRSHFYIQSKYVSVVVLRIIVLRWKKNWICLCTRENLIDTARKYEVAGKDGIHSTDRFSIWSLF